MIALLTACLFFEILVHVLNIVSAKARAKTVLATLSAGALYQGKISGSPGKKSVSSRYTIDERSVRIR